MTTELKHGACGNPAWHGAHDFWWTETGGGHMLVGEPDEQDFVVEKNLTHLHCAGVGGASAVTETTETGSGEPESEQMFAAFDRGVKLGRKQAIEQFYEALRDGPIIPNTVLDRILPLLDEAGLKP